MYFKRLSWSDDDENHHHRVDRADSILEDAAPP